MMGTKVRSFQPMTNVSLDYLVPANHFYRHLERTLDLSFVRELVRDRYAAGGRPSIDPVVFFKLQLVMFFAGLRSERQLERVGADRLRIRWYLGYDLHESLPDHARLTRIRERYGVAIFRRFFEAGIERCRAIGLVWGKELYADATLVEANADRDTMLPRFAVEQHLGGQFGTAYEGAAEPDVLAANELAAHTTDTLNNACALPVELNGALPPERAEQLTIHNQTRHEDCAIQRHGYQRMSDVWVSLTDPDAVLMRQHNHGVHVRYRDLYLFDGGKARIILGVLVTAADVMENMPFLDMLWRACFRWHIRPRSATGDTTYGTVEIIRALDDAGIQAYVPITDGDTRSTLVGRDAFIYNAEADHSTCPHGVILRWDRHDYVNQTQHYRADAAICNACAIKAHCTGLAQYTCPDPGKIFPADLPRWRDVGCALSSCSCIMFPYATVVARTRASLRVQRADASFNAMNITFLQSVACPLDMRTLFLWYASHRDAFIVGDANQLLAYRVANVAAPPVVIHRGTTDEEPGTIYDERLPDDDYARWAASGYNRFHYLAKAEYDRMLPHVGGRRLNYVRRYGVVPGMVVRHPVGEVVFALHPGRMTLYQCIQEACAPVDMLRTRGRQALVYAAHPTEHLVVYGTNAGHLYSVSFTTDGFHSTRKIAVFDQPIHQLTFTTAGTQLVVGGLGTLALFTYHTGVFVQVAQRASAVRELQLVDGDGAILVNQGIHGLALVDITSDSLVLGTHARTTFSLDRTAIAPTTGVAVVTSQQVDDQQLYVYQYMV